MPPPPFPCFLKKIKFTRTMKEFVNMVDNKLATLANNINLNTDRIMAESMETLRKHASQHAQCNGDIGVGVPTL